MGANQYPQILEPVSEMDRQTEDNEKLSSELFEAAAIELNGFENSSGLAESHWPDMNSRWRGRHSYSYYSLNSN